MTSQNRFSLTLSEGAERTNAAVRAHAHSRLRSRDLDRAVAFGEAIQATWLYVGEELVSPPSVRLLEVLEVAHRDLEDVWDEFTPQDFTLYFMSLLLSELENEEQISQLKLGAAKYLSSVGPQLSPELQHLVLGARSLSSMTEIEKGSQNQLLDIEQRETRSSVGCGDQTYSTESNDDRGQPHAAVTADTEVDGFDFGQPVEQIHSRDHQNKEKPRFRSHQVYSVEKTVRQRSNNSRVFSLVVILISLLFAIWSAI